MLRADDVPDARFAQTQLGDGYDQREVDGLLDAVTTALRRHEDGSAAGDVLTSAGVRAATFTPTRFRRGYAAADVDALLERAAEALAAHEGSAPADAPAPVADRTPSVPPAARSGGQGPGARLLRALRGDPRP